MGNEVTVKIDSRVLYGLIALIAVVGIFAIGLWLGDQMNAPAETTASAVPTAAPGAPVAQGAAPQGAVPTLAVGAQPTAETGKPPVSVDEIPVGENQPRIWLPEPAETNWQYDLGSIPATDKTEHEFIVQNVGTSVLEITDASASCGCTAALVEDSSLEPGEQSAIRVSYDPRVNQEFGKFVTKQIRIKSNDPLVPLAEFTITADVQPQ